MATSSMSLPVRDTLVRPVLFAGTMIAIVQVVQQWIVYGLLQQVPMTSVFQYIASGVLGSSAFEGGMATAVLGLLIHLVIAYVIAAVFILSAARIAFVRRYPLTTALLYGFGAFVVLNMIVIPLSAAPPVPAASLPLLVEVVVEHILAIGLPLGILLRNTDSKA